MSDKSEHIPP